MNRYLNLFINVMRGLRAFTVQSYTEANIKNGLQYYARRAWANDAAAGDTFSGASSTPSASNTRYLFLKTGSKGVIVKDRVSKVFGEEFKLTINVSPTLTRANEIVIPVSNFRGDGLAIPTTAFASEIPFADVSSSGTPIDSPEYFFGSTATGQVDQSSINAERERIIPANTEFLVAIQMTAGGGTGRFEYFLTWYEGGTDLPRKEFNL